MLDMPYFMKDKSWYTYDVKKRCYVLTDKAPEKAKKSYKEYYEDLGLHHGKPNRNGKAKEAEK